jgi:hypothetical protein
MTTKLCPAVQELIKNEVCNCEDCKLIIEYLKKGANLQAEYDRERVKKAIQNSITYRARGEREMTTKPKSKILIKILLLVTLILLVWWLLK